MCLEYKISTVKWQQEKLNVISSQIELFLSVIVLVLFIISSYMQWIKVAETLIVIVEVLKSLNRIINEAYLRWKKSFWS